MRKHNRARVFLEAARRTTNMQPGASTPPLVAAHQAPHRAALAQPPSVRANRSISPITPQTSRYVQEQSTLPSCKRGRNHCPVPVPLARMHAPLTQLICEWLAATCQRTNAPSCRTAAVLPLQVPCSPAAGEKGLRGTGTCRGLPWHVAETRRTRAHPPPCAAQTWRGTHRLRVPYKRIQGTHVPMAVNV